MEFFVSGKSHIGFRHIHPLIADLLRALPATTDPDSLSDAAEARLFPEPTNSESLQDLRDDWKAFVEPGLHELFRSASDIVSADLKGMEESGDTFTLTIPMNHADAWLNLLNQARLVLAADLGFNEKILTSPEPPDLGTDVGMAVFRINLYAFMQQCLIEQLE